MTNFGFILVFYSIGALSPYNHVVSISIAPSGNDSGIRWWAKFPLSNKGDICVTE